MMPFVAKSEHEPLKTIPAAANGPEPPDLI